MVLSQYHEKDMERIQYKIKQKSDEQVGSSKIFPDIIEIFFVFRRGKMS